MTMQKRYHFTIIVSKHGMYTCKRDVWDSSLKTMLRRPHPALAVEHAWQPHQGETISTPTTLLVTP